MRTRPFVQRSASCLLVVLVHLRIHKTRRPLATDHDLLAIHMRHTRFIHTSRLRIVSFTARSRSALIHSFNEPQLRLVACCSQAVFAPACNQRAISTRRQSALPRPRVSKPQGIACLSFSVCHCLSLILGLHNDSSVSHCLSHLCLRSLILGPSFIC